MVEITKTEYKSVGKVVELYTIPGTTNTMLKSKHVRVDMILVIYRVYISVGKCPINYINILPDSFHF